MPGKRQGILASDEDTTWNNQAREYFGDGDGNAYSEIEHFYCMAMFMWKNVSGMCKSELSGIWKKENKAMGGKRKLADALIDKLQNYYGMAARSNCGKVEGMKAANLCQHFLLCLNIGPKFKYLLSGWSGQLLPLYAFIHYPENHLTF